MDKAKKDFVKWLNDTGEPEITLDHILEWSVNDYGYGIVSYYNPRDDTIHKRAIEYYHDLPRGSQYLLSSMGIIIHATYKELQDIVSKVSKIKKEVL